MRITGLDLGRNVAACTVDEDMHVIHVHAAAMSPVLKARSENAKDWLNSQWGLLLCNPRPDLLVIEQPWMHPVTERARVNPQSILWIQELVRVTTQFCAEDGIRLELVDPQAVGAATVPKDRRVNMFSLKNGYNAPLDDYIRVDLHPWLGKRGGYGLSQHVADAALLAYFGVSHVLRDDAMKARVL